MKLLLIILYVNKIIWSMIKSSQISVKNKDCNSHCILNFTGKKKRAFS